MIAYHGSNSNFKKFRISRSLVQYESTLENEGLGIYFTLNRETAEQYGKYIYTIEVNDNCLLDFRNADVCASYMYRMANYVYERIGVNVLNKGGMNPRCFSFGEASRYTVYSKGLKR